MSSMRIPDENGHPSAGKTGPRFTMGCLLPPPLGLEQNDLARS